MTEIAPPPAGSDLDRAVGALLAEIAFVRVRLRHPCSGADLRAANVRLHDAAASVQAAWTAVLDAERCAPSDEGARLAMREARALTVFVTEIITNLPTT